LSAREFADTLTATVTVINIGKVAGKEIVQLYLSAPGTSMPKPAIELKGFAKTKTRAPAQAVPNPPDSLSYFSPVATGVITRFRYSTGP
jgi:hypothetical protein